jgi:hypothetical protein
MTAQWRSTWSWRSSLTWALIGPTFILLIEVESALALLDGLGLLPGQLRGWQALAAGAVLALVLAAQLSTTLWRRATAVRSELFVRRRRLEEEESAAARARAKSAYKPRKASVSTPTGADGADSVSAAPDSLKAPSVFILTRSLRKLSVEMSRKSAGFEAAKRILERFGLEPSWALQQLDENLAVPAARRITRVAQLAAARWAGYMTAFIFALVALFSTYGWLGYALSSSADKPPSYAHELIWTGSVLEVLLSLLAIGQYFAIETAGGAARAGEEHFYPEVENLLEFNRFDLYRALDVPSPRDSSEEEKGVISAWRLGSGRISFEQVQPGGESDVQQQVDGLAELLRGPELVSYDGFISWEARDEQVELAFARTPVLNDGYARLQVSGSRTASHAPFDITADSDAVDLVKVRATVNAPVDEGAARMTFDFQRHVEAGLEPPELWFEISQRGRFIQLLRVKAPRPSSQPKP